MQVCEPVGDDMAKGCVSRPVTDKMAECGVSGAVSMTRVNAVLRSLPGTWDAVRLLHHGNMSDIWLLQSNTVSWNLVLKSATESEKVPLGHVPRNFLFKSAARGGNSVSVS